MNFLQSKSKKYSNSVEYEKQHRDSQPTLYQLLNIIFEAIIKNKFKEDTS